MGQVINLESLFAELPAEKPSPSGCGSCGTGKTSERCGNGLEKIYPTTAVRFGYLRYIGEFSHPPDMRFTCGAKVIIQTRRGLELGEQVSLTCGGCDKSVSRDQMKTWVESCGEDAFIFDAGRILREATSSDLAEHAHIQEENLERRRVCRQAARRHGIDIRVADCEATFGGERIIFYFTANERVDFRPIVQDLAQEYRTRIEMRQIGARDEARILADFETCGREVCCKVFLKTLRPITMRMAKLQKATLDPTQVSGRCGRLKCCLRYEHVGYEELNQTLPRTGVRIRTNHGDGVVVNRQILTQLVQIRTDDDKLITVVAEDILEVGIPAPPDLGIRTDGPAGVRPPPSRRERPARPERSNRPPNPTGGDANPGAGKPGIDDADRPGPGPNPNDNLPRPPGDSQSPPRGADPGAAGGRGRNRRRRRDGGRGPDDSVKPPQS